MNQTAPDPTVLIELVDKLKYKENWYVSLRNVDRGQGSEGLTLCILVGTVDSYHPEKPISVMHYMPVPPAAYNERSWCRWLLDQILLVERHEACEFFQIGDDHPYGPNHGPGNDPYIIFDHGSLEDSLVNYTGNR